MKTTFKWIKKHIIVTVVAGTILFLLAASATRYQLPVKNKIATEAVKDSVRDLRKEINKIQVDQVLHEAKKQKVLDGILQEQKTIQQDVSEIKGSLKVIERIVTRGN